MATWPNFGMGSKANTAAWAGVKAYVDDYQTAHLFRVSGSVASVANGVVTDIPLSAAPDTGSPNDTAMCSVVSNRLNFINPGVYLVAMFGSILPDGRRFIEAVPVSGIPVTGGEAWRMAFGSGEEIQNTAVIVVATAANAQLKAQAYQATGAAKAVAVALRVTRLARF